MNGGKDVRLGDDKRPISVVPSDEQFLYNIRDGNILTDEFGNNLITEVDTFYLPDASAERSTSIVFDDKDTPYMRLVHTEVGLTTGYYVDHRDLDVYLKGTAEISGTTGIGGSIPVLQRGGTVVGVGTTAGTGTNALTPVTFFNYDTAVAVTTDTYGRPTIFKDRDGNLASPVPIVRSEKDQGDQTNVIYYPTYLGMGSKIKIGDKVHGEYIQAGTKVVDVAFNSRIVLSKAKRNSGISSVPARVTRSKNTLQKSDVTWKIEEQFKETSEVSTTLLGVNRAETQLSLFSNVSSYGLDPDEFEEYRHVGGLSLGEWESRFNKYYGRRYTNKLTEESNESGIKLEAFPTPYSFPFGPKYERLGWYNEDLFTKYKKFIKMGNDLYDVYKDNASYSEEWKASFLPDTEAVKITLPDGVDDISYVTGITTASAQIDTWTDTWRKISKNVLTDPLDLSGNTVLSFAALNDILSLNGKDSDYAGDNTRPGYSDSEKRFSLMQSRRVFRYQSGRISGFTFGVKTTVESRDGSYIEWGISNPTDQYVFRIDKGNLSIVRRSTIPLDSVALKRSGLELSDQVRMKGNDSTNIDPETGEEREYWTINIPRDNFNGDPLHGNGVSGYTIKPENVTMYKIEFGWYGAIGARFYAYIPAGNGDARWVVMHTIVIENSLGQPCLEDSYFRLVYTVDIYNMSTLYEPQSITKYGASYYIDCGDEGTVAIYSASSGEKVISGISSETLLGIKPKDFIVNSTGSKIQNKKLILPTELNVKTDSLTEIKTVVCKACPGFGHVHTPGILTGQNGRVLPSGDIQFAETDKITTQNNSFFTTLDLGAHLIAPSINNCFIGSLEDATGTIDPNTGLEKYESARLTGTPRGGLYGVARNIAGTFTSTAVIDKVTGIGTNYPVGTTYPYAIRLSQYNGIAVSDFKFTGQKIEVQFANPSNGDDYGHFADYIIGLTDAIPNVDAISNEINYFTESTTAGIGTTTMISDDSILYGRHSCRFATINGDGFETSETYANQNPRVDFDIDYRIPSLSSPNNGICSKITFEIENPTYTTEVYQLNKFPNSGPPRQQVGVTTYFLQVENKSLPNIFYDGGQVAVQKILSEIDPLTGTNKRIVEETPVRFVGITSSYSRYDSNTQTTISYSYIQIDGELTGYGEAVSPADDGVITKNITLAFRPVTASYASDGGVYRSRKLYKWVPYPLYLVAKLTDKAGINNISVKETIGDFTRTVAPRLYYGKNCNTTVPNLGGSVRGDAPTHYKELERLSSAEVDVQNQQLIREPYEVIDTFYVGAGQSKTVDMTKVFGPDRQVITPDNNNVESTFLIARKLDATNSSPLGTIESSLNFKEQ